MITSTPHTHCRACLTALPAAFLDLGMQPLANNLCRGEEHCDDVFPMRLCRCSVCGLLQLDTVIDPVTMFSHYLYTPSQSKKTLTHFEELADATTQRAGLGGFAVDVGSNDGALLGMLKLRGWRVCGVDPAENLAREAISKGLPTMIGFFDEDTVDAILREHGKADVITANNVFAHTPSWATFAASATRLLSSDGLLVIEFPYGPIMLRDGTFDLQYFEHASYPSLTPISYLFTQFGLHVQDIEELPGVHGGSLRVWISFKDVTSPAVTQMLLDEKTSVSETACAQFVEQVERTKIALYEAVQNEWRNGRRVVGFTAPAKCVTLLIAAGLNADDVDYIIDDNPLKQGRMLPKLHIPIRSPADAPLIPGDTVIIFAWNVAEDIMAKLPAGVDVIIPMPAVRVIRR